MAHGGSPDTIAEVIRRNASKRGLAIIITNDYVGADLPTLAGPRKDGNRMKRVFEDLQIATLWKENVSSGELRRLLSELATLTPCPTTYKSISFVFSGHGRDSGELCLQDGQTMKIQEIVDAFLPRQAPNLGKLPKLFFIDACRGEATFQPVVVPRTSGNVQVDRPQRSGTSDRGATDIRTVLVPPQGNTIIAYSNIARHRALESKDGGVWMKALAKRMAECKADNIETVLTKVRQDLLRMYQDPLWRNHMQLPETVSHLLQEVYLHPEAPQLNEPPRPPPANSSPPGTLTQRDESHPGYYKGRFLNLQQKNIIRNVAENYEGNFVCVLRFVKCSNEREYRFRSEQECGTKQEAKESAAKLAVLSLEIEVRGVPRSAPQPQLPRRTNSGSPPQPQTKQRKTASGAPAPPTAPTSPSKDPKTRLKEHCEKNGLEQPVYEVIEGENASYRVRVKVFGKIFTGEQKTTKKEAEKSAAEKALAAI